MLGRSLRRVHGGLRGPVIGLASRLSKGPTRLLIAPQDLRTSDPTVADDLYAGHFTFAGRVVTTEGRSPFALEPPSAGWARHLHGFGWLRHLRAAESELARGQARALVADFLRLKPTLPESRAPGVVARRVISFVSHSPLLLTGADLAFYKRFVSGLARQVVLLKQSLAVEPPGLAHLEGAIALAYAGLAFDRGTGLEARSRAMLEREIQAQILPDGGHVGRNPAVVVTLLLDLLPLRQGYGARGLPIPEALTAAITRLMGHLRMMRHADGTIALFNGAGAIPRDWLATLAIYDDGREEAAEHAAASGYHRLVADQAVVVVDTGCPPPPALSDAAHAGTLAFEFSARGRRIIVNCGAPSEANGAAALAARSTAAHSTAVVADTSSGRFARRPIGARVPLVTGPRAVTSRLARSDDGIALEASHDGYRERFGLVHHRRLALDATGTALTGADRFEGAFRGEDDGVALRFHLAPGLRAGLSEDAAVAVIVAPDGETWRFDAAGRGIMVEESIHFADADGARRSEQLVVAATIRDAVDWSFVKVRDGQGRASGETLA